MGSRILVIDDDSSFRRVMEYNLQEEGYDVVTAGSGEEGMRLFDEQRPELVITDVKMPGMDGLQVLRLVKERSPDTLVIIVTAYGAVDAAVDAMKLGAYDYITKPFNRDEMKIIVRKALQLTSLSRENRRLRSELAVRNDFHSMVGISRAMEKVFQMVERVADTEATVLISGESGTGKELVARAIHSLSSRKEGPFVAVNCAAIPRDLLESELFGHVKGAFTGAVRERKGKFQQATGGSLFLDEVGEMPPELQPKLLRVLQERTVEPVGGDREEKLDVRIVAASNRELEEAMAEGTFREDLFYRLAVIPIRLPPLRERREDIPLLVRHFAARQGTADIVIDSEAMRLLAEYSWPGNVRELENTVERLIIMGGGRAVTVDDLPERMRTGNRKTGERVINLPDDGYSLEDLEREIVVEALQRNNWNQSSASRFLRIPRHVLIYRMEKYGIVPPDKR